MVPARLQPRLLLVVACLVAAAGVVAAAVADPSADGDEAEVATSGGDAPVPTLPTLPPLPSLTLPTIPPLPTVTLPTVTVPPLPPVTLPPLTIPPLPLLELPGVFYVQPEGAAHELLQLAWSGRVIQRLTLPSRIDCCGLQTSAPDGSRFRLGGELYDQQGTYLGDALWGDWGDDGRHFCALWRHDPADMHGPQDLLLREADGVTTRIVATVPAADPGTGSIIVSCSPNHDRAVVSVSNPPTRRTFVIRLSDGAMEELGPACNQSWGTHEAGRFLVAVPHGGAGPANVCDLDTGTVVGTLPRPGRLSGDGTVLVSTELDHCGWYHRLVLSDWRTGERFWSSDEPGYELPCDQLYAVTRFHPTSSAMAMQVHTLNVKAPGAVFVTDGRRPPVRIVDSAEYHVVF